MTLKKKKLRISDYILQNCECSKLIIFYYLVLKWQDFGFLIKEFILAKFRCAKGDNATLSEFEEVLKAMKMSSLIPLAPRIFDLFDNNRDGTVDMREILCGFSSLRNSQGDAALRLCFQVQYSLSVVLSKCRNHTLTHHF